VPLRSPYHHVSITENYQGSEYGIEPFMVKAGCNQEVG